MLPATYQTIRKENEMDKAIIDRFWSKVNKDTDSGCWEWTAYDHPSGYGNFFIGSKAHKAHRISWEIHNGKIPTEDSYHGVCVLHKCDNPKCVNPAHLFLGTHADNMQDMISKGRRDYYGEKNPRARLTAEQVRIIRYWWSLGNMQIKQMAKYFGVGRTTIGHVVHNRSWRKT